MFDVNETLSDIAPIADRFAEIGAPRQLAPLVVRRAAARRARAHCGRGPAAVRGPGRRRAAHWPARSGARPRLRPRRRGRDDAIAHVLAGVAQLSVHPDVPAGIRALRAGGHRLVTLSNGAAEVGQGLLERAGLRDTAKQAIDAVLEVVPGEAWSAPSPCEGWSARDIVAHMVDTQRGLLTSRDVDLGPAPDRAADPAVAWHHHARQMPDVLRDDAVVETGYDGYFGPTTIGATLEQFYVWDMLVHRWDIATSAGLNAGLTDSELDRIEQGADNFGEGLHMEGICKPAGEPPLTPTVRSGCSRGWADAPEAETAQVRPLARSARPGQQCTLTAAAGSGSPSPGGWPTTSCTCLATEHVSQTGAGDRPPSNPSGQERSHSCRRAVL